MKYTKFLALFLLLLLLSATGESKYKNVVQKSAFTTVTLQFEDVPCLVADTSGTPLNIRNSPNGRVIGTLKNGTRVLITDGADSDWVKIKVKRKGEWKVLGWVVSKYLNCNN